MNKTLDEVTEEIAKDLYHVGAIDSSKRSGFLKTRLSCKNY